MGLNIGITYQFSINVLANNLMKKVIKPANSFSFSFELIKSWKLESIT